MGLSGKPLSKEATQAYRTLVWYLRNAAHSCWTLPPDGTAEERHALTTPPPPSTRVSRKAACRRSTECRQRNQGTPRQLRTDRKDPRTRSGASCRDTPARPSPPGSTPPLRPALTCSGGQPRYSSRRRRRCSSSAMAAPRGGRSPGPAPRTPRAPADGTYQRRGRDGKEVSPIERLQCSAEPTEGRGRAAPARRVGRGQFECRRHGGWCPLPLPSPAPRTDTAATEEEPPLPAGVCPGRTAGGQRATSGLALGRWGLKGRS